MLLASKLTTKSFVSDQDRFHRVYLTDITPLVAPRASGLSVHTSVIAIENPALHQNCAAECKADGRWTATHYASQNQAGAAVTMIIAAILFHH